MSQNKKTLRKNYKNTRLSAGVGYVDEKSLEICRNLFKAVDWGKVNRLCSYTAIKNLGEVEVKALHDTISYKFPEIKIELMRQDKKQAFPKGKFDIVIVPCLAFDADNHRLGWGGGFYDRFLATQPQALKIGVAYQTSFVKEGLLHETHDIPLDKIITER